MSRTSVAVPAFVTLMLALLISACASMQSNKLDQLNQQLQTALAGEPVMITEQSGAITLTSGADALYPSGGWQLKPGAPLLGKIVPVLAGLQHTRVVVEGYTDNTPIGPDLQRMGISNNLDLSSKRAAAVVTYLASQGVNPSLMSAQGFGDTHPVASNDTPEGQAKNRRVVIKLIGDGT
jgi:chemotaxis protein MotB